MIVEYQDPLEEACTQGKPIIAAKILPLIFGDIKDIKSVRVRVRVTVRVMVIVRVRLRLRHRLGLGLR